MKKNKHIYIRHDFFTTEEWEKIYAFLEKTHKKGGYKDIPLSRAVANLIYEYVNSHDGGKDNV